MDFSKKFIKKFNIVYDLHFHDRICNKYLLKNNNPNSSGINAENYYHYGNLLDVLPRLAGLYNLPDVSPQFYFPKEEKGNSIVEYKNYIVIHAESNEQDRNWDAEKWNIVCEKLLGSYPLATIIEIGFKQQVTINNNRYISLCNKLTLLQNAIIIKNAVLFIGIDSGFAHFANALNTKSIILLGEYRDFKTYMPYSGEFKNGNNATIFNYPGILRKLDVETVEKLINDKMESFFKSGKNYINGSANNTSLEIINYNYFS